MKNKTIIILTLLLISAASAVTSCKDADDDMLKIMNEDSFTSSYLGREFHGVWTVDGVLADSCTMQVTPAGQLVFDTMPWKKLVMLTQAAADKNLSESDLEIDEASKYTVIYHSTGYSSSSQYNRVDPQDYGFAYSSHGEWHSVRVVMAQDPVFVVDYQNATVAVKFYVAQIYDNQTEALKAGKQSVVITYQANLK
ncbi:MAG: hypothetical protein IJ604_09435 [Prevotella sp.]|nr:hypothetical protein [Prevotella sp.]